MRILIEFDGPVVDSAPVYYEAYRRAVEAVGWAALDQASFRRTIRKEGRSDDLLRGAGPAKLAKFRTCFDEQIESDAVLETAQWQQQIATILGQLERVASCHLVTLGTNVAARQRVLERRSPGCHVQGFHSLNTDPRRRPGELVALAGGDPRTIVAAASDAMIRSADAASLFALGIACGVASEARLFQAGATVVYPSLDELAASLDHGASDLVRAGLLPIPHGDRA